MADDQAVLDFLRKARVRAWSLERFCHELRKLPAPTHYLVLKTLFETVTKQLPPGRPPT